MKIIFIDIDETICITPNDRDYTKSNPIPENIAKINRLYEDGNTIIYWTARGSGNKKDYRDLTENQFKEWGVKYHELRFGKPIYDIIIDDKAINPNMSDTKRLLAEIRKEWLCSRDPVIAYRMGEFAKYEDEMNGHITRMNVLMNKALSYIESKN